MIKIKIKYPREAVKIPLFLLTIKLRIIMNEYKVLHPLPDLDKNDKLIVEWLTVSKIIGSVLVPIWVSAGMVEKHKDFFAIMLFETQDKVKIYEGDTFWQIVGNTTIPVIAKQSQGNYSYTHYSTKEAAEASLQPKFKARQFAVYESDHAKIVFKIIKIGMNNLHGEIEPNKDDWFSMEFCRNATYTEIMEYYKDLGWISGAVFRYMNSSVYTIKQLTVSLLSGEACIVVEDTEAFFPISACELIPSSKAGGFAVLNEKLIFKIREIKEDYLVDDNNGGLCRTIHCRQASPDEIIAYYKKLGWRAGARFSYSAKTFKLDRVSYIHHALIVVISENDNDGHYLQANIEDCELVTNSPTKFHQKLTDRDTNDLLVFTTYDTILSKKQRKERMEKMVAKFIVEVGLNSSKIFRLVGEL